MQMDLASRAQCLFPEGWAVHKPRQCQQSFRPKFFNGQARCSNRLPERIHNGLTLYTSHQARRLLPGGFSASPAPGSQLSPCPPFASTSKTAVDNLFLPSPQLFFQGNLFAGRRFLQLVSCGKIFHSFCAREELQPDAFDEHPDKHFDSTLLAKWLA
jgi:hypothetical protein